MQGQSQQEALLPGSEGQTLRASQQQSGLASPTGIQVSDCSPEQGMGCWRKWGDQNTVRREKLITCSGPSGVRDRGSCKRRMGEAGCLVTEEYRPGQEQSQALSAGSAELPPTLAA